MFMTVELQMWSTDVKELSPNLPIGVPIGESDLFLGTYLSFQNEYLAGCDDTLMHYMHIQSCLKEIQHVGTA